MVNKAKKEKKQPKKLNVKLPKGYTLVKGGDFGKAFFFESPGDTIEGKVISVYDTKYDGKVRTILTLENKKGQFAIWDSTALRELFSEAKKRKGAMVFMRFEGLGSKKKGKQPFKIFTTGIK